MKVLACALLCLVVAVQGRSSGVNSSNTALAALGDAPWLVHLRVATDSSGLLRTCAGSLIDQSWVLTSADCARNLRFAWIRYGTLSVINPSLVTESSTAIVHPSYNPTTGQNNIAVISLNRAVHPTDNIAHMRAAGVNEVEMPETAVLYRYGAEDDGAPGEQLSSITVSLSLQADGDSIVATSTNGDTTGYDSGAPLVVNGVQVGILSQWSTVNGGRTTFLTLEQYLSWLASHTGVDL